MRRERVGAIGLVIWFATGALAGVAVLSSAGRAVEVAARPAGPGLSRGDRLRVERLAAVLDLDRTSERYRQAEAHVAAVTARFNAHPVMTLLHVLPGALLLMLGPLQFSSGLRSRYPTLHRWSGRLLLMAAVPVGLTGLFFGGLIPYAGLSEAIPSVVFGLLFLYAAARAFLAIRRRDIARHREWMLRMFSLALGVGTIRLVGVALMSGLDMDLRDLIGPSFWIGWIATLGAAEWWIRCTRHTRAQEAVRSEGLLGAVSNTPRQPWH